MNPSTAPKPPVAAARSEINELDALVRRLTGRRLAGNDAAGGLYRAMLDEFERPLLAEVLERCGNNQTRAAALLGLSRGTLRAKLRHHRLSGRAGV